MQGSNFFFFREPKSSLKVMCIETRVQLSGSLQKFEGAPWEFKGAPAPGNPKFWALKCIIWYVEHSRDVHLINTSFSLSGEIS